MMKMKCTYFISRIGLVMALAAFCAGTLKAQEVVHEDSLRRQQNATADSGTWMKPATQSMEAERMAAQGKQSEDTLVADTSRSAYDLQIPSLYRNGTVAYFPGSYLGGYWGLWDLHEGFNASLGMSVAASFGKHSFPGVGFGTGISAMYVRSLTDRLVLAVGGFYNRLSWNGFNDNRFGFNILAGYQLTDRLGIYAYGSKSFVPGGMLRAPMMFPPWMDDFSSRLGGMLHLKVSDAFSISLSVEEAR